MNGKEFEIVYLDDSPPIMLAARAPGQVAAQPDASGAVVFRGARSGNKNFDPATGKFAGKKLKGINVIQQAGAAIQEGAQPQRSGKPTNVGPHQWERRLDVVREAARLTDVMDEISTTQWLAERVQDVSQVDIQAFMADVRLQRVSDLVDSLDATTHARVDRSPVRVVAQKRWTTRVFNDLTQAESLSLVKRLEGKGWNSADISKYVVDKIKDQALRDFLQQSYGEPVAPEGKTLKQQQQ